MRVKLFFIPALLALLAACGSPAGFESELQTVDSLQTELRTYKQKMDSVDMESLSAELEEISRVNAYLLKHYEDSLDRKFWIEDMSKMRRIQKAYDRFLTNEAEIYRKIELAEKQLQGLANSLEDEKLEQELAQEYVETEKLALAEIRFLVMKLQPEYLISRDLWQEIGPSMSATADSVREFNSRQP